MRVHVIVNPAAGRNDPILNVLNRVFEPAGVAWDVSVTHVAGDACRYATQAAEAGVDVVVVYGGDGTVREVAGVLQGSDIPLAILPGGTANLTAIELGLPRNIWRAARLITGEHDLRLIDVGMANGEAFLVAAATGLIARVMDEAGREMKNRLGPAAYYLIGLRELGRPERARYRLTLDGKTVEQGGIACLIANSGSVGISGLSVPAAANLSDGLLHVVVFPGADLLTVGATVIDAVGLQELAAALPRWTATEVVLEAAPVETITCDGDITGRTPVTARILHNVLKVIVPRRVFPVRPDSSL
jgi:YegS/Rv2252/BmrU family lipid kinase